MIVPASRFHSPLRNLAVALATAVPLLWAAPVTARGSGDEATASSVPSPRARVRMNARVFDTVWNAVRRQYYDPDLHGVDWRQARETYRPLALAATDDRLLYRAVGQMLDLLDDQHAGAISPAMAQREALSGSRRAVMGVTMSRLSYDVWRVDSVRAGSPAEEAGIQPGWKLQSVDGETWGVDFPVLDGQPVSMAMIDLQGDLQTITVIPREMDAVPPFSIDASRIGVVVFRVAGFEPGTGRWLGEQLERLPPDTDVILDLRGNPGGLLLEADATLSCFLPARQDWATRISRSGRTVTLSVMPGCGPLRVPIANDLALLVDANSRSAAELTPAALQESGRALVVGEHTAGAVLISQDMRLPDGGRLTLSRADYITSGGVRLEKRGVEPDILATRSMEDLRAGRDPALEAAIEALAARGPAGPPIVSEDAGLEVRAPG